MVCWDGYTRLGPGRDPLQTVIKITLLAAQNRTAKIPVGSDEKMMGCCPLWSGQFRIPFIWQVFGEERLALSVQKAGTPVTVFFCRTRAGWRSASSGDTDTRGNYPDKCIGPTCHTCYLYLYTESQVSTGTASDPWEALYW